ncbi:hypothetical protein [Stenomitos frigidus]|uniref:Uncharacterized protein n=1 Tax=Stenomitos frigidus ULC18 TaxID=2107698 RepID=A0A2T1DVX2_9CYAN|nr:hypothetical protein [Stenomitos frigidus]PSB24637.1 hypothetical protein C7B82_26865 [Stenomitos frigidus ULC18]
MDDATLVRSRSLKQALADFVLDAEGELATALECYSAEQLARSPQSDQHQQALVIDRFVVEGTVGKQTPIDLFIAETSDLSKSDRQLLEGWKRSFVGLFAVTQKLPDGFELMNWLTAKPYSVKPNDPAALEEMQRLKLGEILLTQIAPITDKTWTFSAPWKAMGSLGKPKLAVAIGNFKQNYKESLYSDAPELLEEAWRSVERYHQDFLDFFGSDAITLPGYQLVKKITEFQEVLTKKQLAEAGIDESKSMADLAAEAGMDEAAIEEAAEAMGADAKAVSTMLKSKETAAKMVTPKIDLPPELKKAEAVTVLAHPRWGQVFLPTYTQLETVLQAEDWQSVPGAEKLIRKHLDDANTNAFVWHHLAATYPASLETVLRSVLERPTFDLQKDLDSLLEEHKKPLQPELPEIASVPLHLHDLFQEALKEVSKSKPKEKDGQKAKKGFQR